MEIVRLGKGNLEILIGKLYTTKHHNFTVIDHKQENVDNDDVIFIFVSVQSACSPFGDLVCFKNNGSAVGSCQQVI